MQLSCACSRPAWGLLVWAFEPCVAYRMPFALRMPLPTLGSVADCCARSLMAMDALCSPPSSIIVIGSSFCKSGATLAMAKD